MNILSGCCGISKKECTILMVDTVLILVVFALSVTFFGKPRAASAAL